MTYRDPDAIQPARDYWPVGEVRPYAPSAAVRERVATRISPMGVTPREVAQVLADTEWETQAPLSKKERRRKSHNRPLRLNHLPPGTTKRDYVYARDGHRCVKCGSTDDLTLDHIRPVRFGGSNHYANLQTMCGSCNNRKGDRWDGRSGMGKNVERAM